jgi:glycosyltransferase involved in cell wall biosynthesis
MKAALLISTYNWKESLNLIFLSILQQTKLPDEILIADDGSKEDTAELIKFYQQKISVPVRHIWQEDKGFRKTQILNKSIAQTKADYIIQTDGDCILHKNFVKDHINNAKENVFLYGSRVNILPNYVTEIYTNQKISFSVFSKEIKNKTRTLWIPLFSKLYCSHQGLPKKFRGCNVSFWRNDFIAVNGYNEDIQGWGREDSELILRMLHKGVLGKRIRYAGIIYHIYHKINPKDNLKLNDAIQQKTISDKIIYIKNGVNKYLNPSDELRCECPQCQ